MASATVDLSPMRGFGIKFFKALSEIEGNVISSPVSAFTALAMVLFGARGKTQDEMSEILELSSQDEIAVRFQGLLSMSRNIAGVELQLANKAFAAADLNINVGYAKALVKIFSSEMENVNFAAPEARTTINSWVEKVTNNKIKDLFADDFDSGTRLVLVNAVYFKGKWKVPFKKTLTKSEPFKTENGSVEVQMMNQEGSFLYRMLEKHDAQLIEIPYEGDEMSMVIILPNKENGLPELEQSLGQESLSEMLSKAKETKNINLSLPKFKIETFIDLTPKLKKMGMMEMFDEQNADFSGITSEKVSVTSVVQKAFIEVNEEGTEAAAATGVEISVTSLPYFIDFNCDHPFLYFVVHERLYSVFGGRVSNPDKEN